ncbi:hypothetical protein L208DRAFT_257583 [Tricholoma matsutake]|nr:hypothetical protein L208DRAFT_257583 [Tricholoma matsutake 945]
MANPGDAPRTVGPHRLPLPCILRGEGFFFFMFLPRPLRQMRGLFIYINNVVYVFNHIIPHSLAFNVRDVVN